MPFTRTEPKRDGVAVQYLLIKPGPVDADALCTELEAALGLRLRGEDQQGHLVTGQIAYTDQVIVQIRLRDGTPPLTPAQEQAAEQAIARHRPR